MHHRRPVLRHVLAPSIALLACQASDAGLPREIPRIGEADALTAEITPSDSILLEWEVVPGATYSIHRSTNPGFAIGGPDDVLIADDLTEGSFEDEYAVTPFDPIEPDTPYDIGVFYRLVQHGPEGDLASAAYGMVPIPVRYSFEGNPFRFSKIPLCLDPSPAEALRDLLLSEQPLSIHRWVPATQSFVADGNPFGSVLGLVVGSVSSVRTPQISPEGISGPLDRYSLTGRVPDECELVTPLHEGLDSLTWPVTSEVITASDLLASIPGATAVGQWRLADFPFSAGQAIAWYPDVPAVTFPSVTQHASDDFDIHPCTAVDVYIDASDDPDGTPLDVTWPPGAPICGP